MDELLSPCSSFSPPSPSSMFSTGAAAAHAVLEFTSCEVPDEWLMGDVVVAKNEEDVGGELWPVFAGGSLSPDSELSGGGGGGKASYHGGGAASGLDEAVEVRKMGRDAATVRVTTTGARHAPARLMGALRSLELPVQHACVMRVHGVTTVQEVLVDVPAALQDDDALHTALLQRLTAS
uniref:Transcription factor n=1 Tax=Oryza punctata TaxID=4537 RepID=A0A0E0M3H7_ORYPU